MSDIAVDTSAVAELVIKGPQADAIKQALQSTAVVFVASIARVETAMVMLGRMGWDRRRFDRDWQGLGLQEVPVDSALSGLAIDALERWAVAVRRRRSTSAIASLTLWRPRETFRSCSWATIFQRPTSSAPNPLN